MKGNYFLIAICIAIVLAVMPVSASLQVSGTVKYMENVAPGSTVTFPVIVSIGDSDPASDYNVTVLGFGNDPQGDYVALPGDSGIQDARPYLFLDKTALHIEPRISQMVTATLTVPEKFDGGMYALINIRQAQATENGTGISTAINIPVMVTVAGSKIRDAGKIDQIQIEQSGNQVTVTTEFTNTGNHHYYGVKNLIEISGSNGMMVGTHVSDPLVTAVVPGGMVNITQQVNVTLPGTYTVRSYVMLEDGRILDNMVNQFGTGELTLPTPTIEPPRDWIGDLGGIIFGGIVVGALLLGVIWLLNRRRG